MNHKKDHSKHQLICLFSNNSEYLPDIRGRHDQLVVGFTPLPMQSVPITTRVCEFESRSDKVYLIQHYVIKFVSDLRQVGSFLGVLRFPP